MRWSVHVPTESGETVRTLTDYPMGVSRFFIQFLMNYHISAVVIVVEEIASPHNSPHPYIPLSYATVVEAS